jgi:hypothetical protein
MFSFFKRKSPEKWVLVKTHQLDITHTVRDAVTRGKLYIHLFESEKGNRRIENACSFVGYPQMEVDAYVQTLEIYQTGIYRWLSGRVDPTIPTYSQIPEEDTANILKGSIS